MSANVARNSPLSVSGKAIRSSGTWVGRLISRPVPEQELPSLSRPMSTMRQTRLFVPGDGNAAPGTTGVAMIFSTPTDATRGRVRALQTLLFGRSNKVCEQSNHAHSDNQHCKCYGIVVQPIQPLLHDTPPLRSETATKTMPSGRLAFPCP
jgi:hypothetical protein